MKELEYAMDIYVVRIHKRDRRDTEKVAGMVEIVDSVNQVFFQSVEELVAILNPARRKSKKRRAETAGPE
jgi:hypothetical protein